MLARQRKRALWSLSVGAVIAAAMYGYRVIALRAMDAELAQATKACWASPMENGHPIQKLRDPKTGEWGDVVLDRTLECEPNALSRYGLSGPEQRVYDAFNEMEDKASNLSDLIILVIVLSVSPLVWYFLLDRIRELGAAISGRDRTG